MDRNYYGFIIFLSVAGAAVGACVIAYYRSRPAEVELPPKSEDQSRVRNRSRNPFDILYPLSTHDSRDEVEVDIIAVHGLASDVDWAWTWKDGNKSVHWLQDLDMLPAKVPKSRITVFNYESQWHRGAPGTRLELCGEELIRHANSSLPTPPHRPIIFIGHSLGGNVIVDALLFASRGDEFKPLLDRIVGLVFLGTPFRGTKLQPYLNRLTSFMQPAGSHDGITRELHYDEPRLLDKLHYFCRLCNQLSMPVTCFYELYKTDLRRRFGISGLIKEHVVEEASACIPGFERYGLQTDHKEISKYDSPNNRSFLAVSEVINRMYTNAKDVVGRRQEPHPIITNPDYALRYKPEAWACLRDLFLVDPSEHRRALKRRKGGRTPGTCEWILGTEELTKWLHPRQRTGPGQKASSLLWLHGNPGTGKSTTAIFLTEELSKSFVSTDGKTLAYFFCDSGHETQRTATSVVRGLILQLVQQRPLLLDYILPQWNKRGTRLFTSFDGLWEIFMAMAADELTGQKYCIIDALDECDKESQDTLLLQFKQTFYGKIITPNLRMLVISRPYEEISMHLKFLTNMDLASYPVGRKDVDLCIEARVDDLATKKDYTDKVKQRVLDIIKTKAEGTFLWVGLACAELNDVPSTDAVKTLDDIPKGLHLLYEKLFSAAISREGASADAIRRILGFVAICQMPLTLLQLSEACELHHKEDDRETQLQFMRDEVARCRRLITIQDRHVLLLHQSVRDFINKLGDADIPKAHADLAYRCIDVIIEEFRTDKRTHLSIYAIRYWVDHARMADLKFRIMHSQADFFAVNSPCREWWLKRKDPLSDKISIWRVAAKWGIPALINHLASLDTRPQEPLVAEAALFGHLNIIPKMFDAGWEDPADLLVPAAENEKYGREFMVLLLDRLGNKITINEQVLMAAASNCWHGKEILILLLDRRGDQIKITEGILSAVAQNQRLGKELMELLFERRGSQIVITKEVLRAAAENEGQGKDILVLLFYERGNSIPTAEEVLCAAAGNEGQGMEIVRLLCDRWSNQITITEAVLVAAASNPVWGTNIIELFLKRWGDRITITEEVFIAAVGNKSQNKGIMKLLLRWLGDQIQITQRMAQAAAENSIDVLDITAELFD